MDEKVKDMQRAAYWKTQGYTFDPTYMTAYAMDEKCQKIFNVPHIGRLRDITSTQRVHDCVCDAGRKGQRYSACRILEDLKDTTLTRRFHLTAYVRWMRRLSDIQRAAYWKAQGYNFDSTFMTAYAMDEKVKDIQRAAYWKTQGHNFDPTYMTASTMDFEVVEAQQRE